VGVVTVVTAIVTESPSLEQDPEVADTLYLPALLACMLAMPNGLVLEVLPSGNVHVTGNTPLAVKVSVLPWQTGLEEGAMVAFVGLGLTTKVPAETVGLLHPRLVLATTE